MGNKKILYIDMDNVLVDFPSAFPKLDKDVFDKYENKDDIPEIFRLMEPIKGAVEAFEILSKQFDVYVLSTAPWENPSAWSDKVNWVKKYLGDFAYKRLILTHHKNLNKGDYLIDDRIKNGASEFEGELIHFGSEKFPNWDSVLMYLLPNKNDQMIDKKIKLNKEEIKKIDEVISGFLEKGIKDNPPKFIVITGPIASGKTTYRRETYPKDYVLIDSGELFDIFDAFDGKSNKNSERKAEYLMVTGIELVKQSILEKKNIIIEITTDSNGRLENLKKITDKMELLGYQIKVEVINCDLEECQKRNQKGRDNVSSYYSTDETIHYFLVCFENQ